MAQGALNITAMRQKKITKITNADSDIVGCWLVKAKNRYVQVTTEFGKELWTKRMSNGLKAADEIVELSKLAPLSHFNLVDRGYESW